MSFFFNDGNKKELLKELKKWEGTPYRHRMMKMNKGCDCIHFVIAIMNHFGILTVKEKDIPEYSRDRHLHNTHSLLIEHFCKHKNFIDVYRNKNKNFMDGDILFFSVGMTIGHVGIYCDKLIYEATVKGGVMGLTFGNSSWHSRLKKVMRAIR